jgi:hypothetical protein
MKAYKGFDKNLKCRGMQYEFGSTYETDKPPIKCGANGFHSCEYPMDVFGYYGPADSRFCEVEADGAIDRDNQDSKVASSKITIGLEVGIKGIVEGAVKFIFDKINWKDAKVSNDKDRSAATNTGDQSAATNTGYQSAATNTGYQSAATNTGDRSAATNTGYQSAATNTGYQSAATNTGDQSAATNTGDQSAATNTGYQSAATNTGDPSAATNTGYQSAATNTGYRSAATNTGYQSAATNTGYQSAATNTGDRSAATVEGKESVAASLGIEGKVKGALGCWLVLSEWFEDDNGNWHRKDVRCAMVDGEIIKADTWYQLVDGQLKEI